MKQKILADYYEAQTSLLRLERENDALAEKVKQAKYALRSRETAEVEYSGTLRSLRDRLFGRREERLEELKRDIRQAKAELETLVSRQRKTEESLAGIRSALEEMPALPLLREGQESEWAALELRYCAEVLAPLLEENRKALLDYRSLMRGERPEILSEWTQQEIYSRPNTLADACLPWLNRLTEAMAILERPFDMGDYYRSPAAYLVNVAAKHNRFDRVNNALDQVEKLQSRIKSL